MEGIVGGKRADFGGHAPPNLVTTPHTADELKMSGKVVEIGFATDRYAFLESCCMAKVVLVRAGPPEPEVSVQVKSREGTAKEHSDYKPVDDIITFAPGEIEKEYFVEIIDDAAYEEDEEFYLELSAPLCKDPSSDFKSIDLDGFIALVSDDQLSEGSLLKSGIKRDCKILREALKMENNYNLYKDDGHWNQGGNAIKGPTGRMALLADVVPGIVIVMNALVLGLSSDIAEDHLVWKAFNIFFLAFYTLEFIVKVYLFGWRWFFLGDEWAWNYFDVFCLALSWVEEVITWILTAVNNGQSVDLNTMVFIRMLRLTRLVRLVRTLRFEIFYELKMMVLGVVSGMRVLIWAMVLLLVIIYTTGVAAKNVFGQEEPEFETVPAAMFTLFRCFTDGCESYDGKPLMERMRPKYGVLLVVSYVCIRPLLRGKLMGIDNTANKMEVDIKDSLLRLVLRSKTNGVPEEVEEDLRAISQTFHRWDARVRAMFETLSSSQVVITKPAFLSWLQDKEFISVLKEADIETANQAGIFECLDADMTLV
eukprot:g15104.t1